MAFVDTGITEPDFQQGHRVLDAASVWLREASRDGKRAIDRKSMSSTYGGSLSARALNKMSDPAQKIVVSAGGLSARDSWRLAKEPAPKQGGLLLPLTADERKLQDLVQSMASKAALRFASI
ncbi:DNHD1, partial [Symbiodinium sp. CCMP2456]